MLSNSAGSHNTVSDHPSTNLAESYLTVECGECRRGFRVVRQPDALVRTRAERLQLALELG